MSLVIDTHYYYRPPTLDADAFSAFSSDVAKLIAAAPPGVVLCGKDGTGKPVVSPRIVCFNGDRASGAEHEPFILERIYTLRPPERMRDGVFFDFCKTNGKPYDLIVVAAIYAFIHHFPACKCTTDSKQEELKPGFDHFFNICAPNGDLDLLFKRPIADR